MCESFVTIANDDVSSLECLVLCNSLKQTGTDKLISVIINTSVSYHLKSVLRKSFDRVYDINDLYTTSEDRNIYDVHGNYEKLKCWLLIDLTKCVFLESDVLVVENIDDLFDRLELSAASDPRWPDCFDDGVFVYQPCLKTYKQLIDYSIANQIRDNSFQCLLNMFFCDWNIINMARKIPFVYNCQMNATFYTHTAALVHFGHSIKAARMGHSIFNLMQPDTSKSDINHENWSRLWKKWWKIFNEMVKPAISNDDTLNFKRTGCDYSKKSDVKNEQSENQSQRPKETNYTSTIKSSYSDQESEWSCQTSFSNLNNTLPNEESICPSQDFTISENYSDAVQSISQEEHCEGTDATSVESQAVGGIEETVSIIDPVDEERIIEELEKTHRLKWERGEIDYMGKDSFENILVKLNSTMESLNNEVENVEE